MQLLLAVSNQIAANNRSRKHHLYATLGAAILHLPKHETVKSTHWSKVMSSLYARPVKTSRWRSAGIAKPSSICQG